MRRLDRADVSNGSQAASAIDMPTSSISMALRSGYLTLFQGPSGTMSALLAGLAVATACNGGIVVAGGIIVAGVVFLLRGGPQKAGGGRPRSHGRYC